MARCPFRRRHGNESRCRESGFVLIVTCIVVAILLGLAGLSVDIARMYVIQTELQAYADAAALSAALQLDGTDRGIEHARKAAFDLATGPHAMRWDMGSQTITDIATSFTDHQAKVVVQAPAPLIFLRALPAGKSGSSLVAASSVAAKTPDGAKLIQ